MQDQKRNLLHPHHPGGGGGGRCRRRKALDGSRRCSVGSALELLPKRDPRALQGTNLEAPVPDWGQNSVTPNTEDAAALSCWPKHPLRAKVLVTGTASLHCEAPKSDISPSSAPHRATSALAQQLGKSRGQAAGAPWAHPEKGERELSCRKLLLMQT